MSGQKIFKLKYTFDIVGFKYSDCEVLGLIIYDVFVSITFKVSCFNNTDIPQYIGFKTTRTHSRKKLRSSVFFWIVMKKGNRHELPLKEIDVTTIK